MKNIYVLALVLLFLGCQSKIEPQTAGKQTDENQVTLTSQQLKNADLSLGNIEEQALQSTVKVNGKITLSPESVASVSMPLGGYVQAIKVMPGMKVQKGQVLAVVEDQAFVQLQQDYLTTKQQLIFATKDYQRQKELNASQASSDKSYQLAESEWAKYKITLKALDEKLRLIHINPATLTENSISKSVRILAPISGMVTQVNINIGKYITATDALFQLMDNTSMYAQLQVFDKDAALLQIGQPVTVFTNAQPNVKYTTAVAFVNKNFEAQSNAIEVYAKINNRTNTLIPGNYVNGVIELNNAHAFVVPNDAVVHFEGKNYVFIQTEPLVFEMVAVQTGIVTKEVIEIRNYEALIGKKIVIKNAYTVLMALKNKEE